MAVPISGRLGYLSGHAAVALGAALPRLGPAARALTLTAMPLAGPTRLYVGAHLPLDIAGGAALGLAAEAPAGLALATEIRAGIGDSPDVRRCARPHP